MSDLAARKMRAVQLRLLNTRNARRILSSVEGMIHGSQLPGQEGVEMFQTWMALGGRLLVGVVLGIILMALLTFLRHGA